MTRFLRISLFLAALALGASSGTAEAQRRGGNFGIGGEVGNPFGLTMKLRTHSGFALQIDAGWGGFGWGPGWHGNEFQTSVDFLWAIDIASLRRTEMSFYFGAGPKLVFAGWNTWNNNPHWNIFFGGRVPLGLDWEFKRRSLDVFVEAAPGFLFGDTWDADTNPNLFFWMDFSAGARYWF